MQRKSNVLGAVIATTLSLGYYMFFAQRLMTPVVNGLSAAMGLPAGPALSALWFVAEVIFMALPFAVVAAVALATRSMPGGAWLAPLVAFWVPAIAVIVVELLLTGGIRGFSGLGGALQPSVAMPADVLGTGLGCALVILAGRRIAPVSGDTTDAAPGARS